MNAFEDVGFDPDVAGRRDPLKTAWAPDGYGGFEQKTLAGMQRTSGTAKDGRYRAVVTVEQYEASGTWHAAVEVVDAALPGNNGWWIDQALFDALLPRYSGFASWASVVPGGSFEALTPNPTPPLPCCTR